MSQDIESTRLYGFKIGDMVTQIDAQQPTGLMYGLDYTIVKLEQRIGNPEGDLMNLEGNGSNGWWVWESWFTHTIIGLCKDCTNTCRERGKEECPFFEEGEKSV